MIDKLIGNYRITGQLAQGGMGTVYRGRHQNLPREVVVKSIRLSAFEPQHQEQLKARFVREAYVQSQLDHPSIVRVYEFFTTQENYYLVMEFIDGLSLRELIKRRGALSSAHAIPLLKQALWGLAYAHNFSYVDEAGNHLNGVIHRDIKPANLLVDGMGRLKITDFGIVKLAGESGMTRTGFNPGTVEYMSPEQIRGLKVDARSDLYSLGVTFYEALSGTLPFSSTDSGSDYEVMRGHTEVPPPPLRTVRPELEVSVERLIMRSLEKDPANRFQSADQWLAAILEYENERGTGSETEVLPGLPTSEANRLTEHIETPHSTSGSVPPVAPALTPPMAQEVPVTQLTQNANAKAGSNRGALIAVAVAFLFIVVAGGAFLVWQLKGAFGETNGSVAVPQASPIVAPPNASTASTAPTPEDGRVRAAKEAVDDERYGEAIKLYEEYLSSNPPGDTAPIARRLSELKAFNGHLQMAKVWMDKGDFAEARKDYAAAVKVRPESQIARAGLAAAEAKLR
jgi:serine/threonine-protein kinase